MAHPTTDGHDAGINSPRRTRPSTRTSVYRRVPSGLPKPGAKPKRITSTKKTADFSEASTFRAWWFLPLDSLMDKPRLSRQRLSNATLVRVDGASFGHDRRGWKKPRRRMGLFLIGRSIRTAIAPRRCRTDHEWPVGDCQLSVTEQRERTFRDEPQRSLSRLSRFDR